jgi:hypothetical protein
VGNGESPDFRNFTNKKIDEKPIKRLYASHSAIGRTLTTDLGIGIKQLIDWGQVK